MKKYQVKIKGVTPYMQHRMDDMKLEEWEKNRGRIIERADVNKEDLIRAEFHIYRNSKGEAFFPSEHLEGSMINAGQYVGVGSFRPQCNGKFGRFEIKSFEPIK